MALDDNDARVRRCPMLGHELNFSYCRQPGGQSTPCRKIFDCWYEQFDVRGFMQSHYPQATLDAILQPKPAKMATLLDIIQRARQNQD